MSRKSGESGSKTKKGKGLAVAVEEKPRFLELHYIVTEYVTGYTQILQQLRAMLAAQGGKIHEIPTLPSEAGKGKALYVKLHLRCDTSSCILFIRASDLYIIGYESAVELVSLKPDNEKAQEIDERFASGDLRRRVRKLKVRPLGFEGNYNSLVRTSSYSMLDMVPVGFLALKKAIRILGSNIDSEKHIATRVLQLIFTFSEATRFKNVESYITTNFVNHDDMGSAQMEKWLSDWFYYWRKLSQVIMSGGTGRHPILVDMKLKLGSEDEYLETVEQARNIIAIMPNPM